MMGACVRACCVRVRVRVRVRMAGMCACVCVCVRVGCWFHVRIQPVACPMPVGGPDRLPSGPSRPANASQLRLASAVVFRRRKYLAATSRASTALFVLLHASLHDASAHASQNPPAFVSFSALFCPWVLSSPLRHHNLRAPVSPPPALLHPCWLCCADHNRLMTRRGQMPARACAAPPTTGHLLLQHTHSFARQPLQRSRRPPGGVCQSVSTVRALPASLV
jgi:hypothetical protein